MVKRSGNRPAAIRPLRHVNLACLLSGLALVGAARPATAGSLPFVASAQAATPGATAPVPPSSPFRLRGQKLSGPYLQRSEAGISWVLRPRLSLELNYERSALGPTMRNDHDDGILTRFKIGF